MEKWVEHELVKVNKGIVTRKRRLRELLDENDPQCVTKEGDVYRFDREALERCAAVLLEGEDILIPVTLDFSSAAGDSCYISDDIAAAMLRRLERFGDAYLYRDGKMWLPNSLAYAILQKYPTVFQGMFL